MRRFVTLLAATVLAAAAHGQTTINGGRRIQGVWDASGASASKPAPTGAGLPGSCEVGEQYFRTDAPVGQNLYLCTAPDTWTAISGGGTAGGTLTVNAAEATGTNLSDTTPAAPSMGAITNRGINVKWQKDASAPDNVSAYIPYGGLLLPTMNVRRWGMWAAPGFGVNPSVFGDYIGGNQGTLASVYADVNNGPLMKYTSAATVGSVAGSGGAMNWRTGRNIHGMWEGKIEQTSGVRSWVAWSTDGTTDGDTFTKGHVVGFRYSSCAEGCAGDTNWQCYSYNGASSIADSGVAPSTTATQLLEVIFDDNSSPRTVTYRINGAPVCEFRSDEHNIPAVGQNMALYFRVYAQEEAAKDISLAWALTSADR